MSDERLRLDRWLVHARFARTREKAQALILAGRVRVNRQPIDKPASAVKPGDVLTLTLGGAVRVVRIARLGDRRGPAEAARRLYDEVPPGAG